MEFTPLPNVLIVEDDPAIAELIQLTLGAGYFYRWVKNGRAAIHVARQEQPALIIMDVMMPEMDGYTAASLLAAEDATRNIPIMVLTSKRGMQDAFSSPNVATFMEKP